DRLLPEYEDLISAEFPDAPVFALKVPRGLALPFWRRMQDRFDVRVLKLTRREDDQCGSIAHVWQTSTDPVKRDGGEPLIRAQLSLWSG
ncbi:hypothetical protein, partial [Sabulibacter ruber]